LALGKNVRLEKKEKKVKDDVLSALNQILLSIPYNY